MNYYIYGIYIFFFKKKKWWNDRYKVYMVQIVQTNKIKNNNVNIFYIIYIYLIKN